MLGKYSCLFDYLHVIFSSPNSFPLGRSFPGVYLVLPNSKPHWTFCILKKLLNSRIRYIWDCWNKNNDDKKDIKCQIDWDISFHAPEPVSPDWTVGEYTEEMYFIWFLYPWSCQLSWMDSKVTVGAWGHSHNYILFHVVVCKTPVDKMGF